MAPTPFILLIKQSPTSREIARSRSSLRLCSLTLSPCLSSSSEVCEQPRRARDAVNAVHHAVHGGLLRSSHEYWAKKEALLTHEQVINSYFSLTVYLPPL